MSASRTIGGVGKPSPAYDRAHDILRTERHALDPIFRPHSVAVIGATETAGSVGRAVVWSLLSSPFGGTVYPVSDKHSSVLGIKAYRHVLDIPEPVDLGVIVTPAATVPPIISECVQAEVGGVIVISAGFKEHGEAGEVLELEIAQRMRGSRMRLIGPNCLGIMNPITGLNATFSSHTARPGNVAFISQSGALCTAVLDWCHKEMVGFSAFVSIGSMLDVGWGDLIDYLGNDPRTHSIIMYMESVGDARSFLSAAREVSLSKPIIVIKAGHTQAAARAAASHTGSLTGSDEVLDAAFRRCGALRVNSIADLFYMADILGKQPRPSGPRLAIVTNAGGPGVLAADSIVANGGELAELSGSVMQGLDSLLPPHWSHNNPVDVLGDAAPEKYAKAVDLVLHDQNVDGLLAIFCPQELSDPTQTADRVKEFAQNTGKPVIASWMGGPSMAAGLEILNRAGIPTFPFPDTAAKVFYYMWRYSYNLRGLYETPVLPLDSDKGPDRSCAEALVQSARSAGRTVLTEAESKQLLAAYGIPVVAVKVARSEAEAVQCSDEIGYPVVLKVCSDTVTHKSDVGGVQLNLGDVNAVRCAYRTMERSVGELAGSEHFCGVTVQPMIRHTGHELIVGSSVDPQFGPVLLFGAGGQLVELLGDRAVALPPLNTTLARRMMEQTKVCNVLKGCRRSKAVDLAALEELLVRFSHLVVEQRWIREIDINPLLASSEGLLALDARIILYGLEIKPELLPRPAIRPYPIQYVKPATLNNGEPVLLRPIRPEDEPLVRKFHQGLSERTVQLRYFEPLKLSLRTAHERLTRICFNDYDRELALVVERKSPDGSPEIIAIGRMSKLRGRNEGELAVLVDDRFQHQGMGTELFRSLIEVARQEKLDRVLCTMVLENFEMIAICRKLHFHLQSDQQDGIMHAELRL